MAEPKKHVEFDSSSIDIEKMSVNDLNIFLVNLITAIHSEKYSVGLITQEGMSDETKLMLGKIEDYFGRRLIGGQEIETLDEKESAYLAIGLNLRSIAESVPGSESDFTPNPRPVLAGVTFVTHGESRKDRNDYFLQQDRKFSYRRDNSEAAKYYLLHTLTYDQEGASTRYERIQSQNLENARKAMNNLMMWKMGNYNSQDVLDINKHLLDGLVPERCFDKLRQSWDVKVGERIGATQPNHIEGDLATLFNNVYEYVNYAPMISNHVSRDEIIKYLAREWVCYDAIHPTEEGNGREGTLFLESWLILSGIPFAKLESTRSETWNIAAAIRSSLPKEGDEFRYERDRQSITDEKLAKVISFIKGHLVDNWGEVVKL